MSVRTVVAVDLGKSRCRVRADVANGPVLLDGIGVPGLAAPGGAAQAAEAILALLQQLPLPADVIGVGAAGALAAPEAAAQLAEHLATATSAELAVASDVATAHAGAFGGRPGVLLIAGTGATALGVNLDGSRLVDGWGPELGDFGSGSWIGREALRASLQAEAGLGGGSAMCSAITERTGSPVHWLAQDGATARRLASLAPVVIEFAAAGDPIAGAIVSEAVQLLVATAAAAGGPDVATYGGLTGSTYFCQALHDGLRETGRVVTPPAGDALDGALLIVSGQAPLHERFVHRAG